MRKPITMLALTFAAMALSAAALAHDGGRGRDDDDGRKHGHVKRTFTVTTTDNGSCGNAWATDVVRRTFIVQENRDGSFRLTRLDRGRFVTLAGRSPGACDTDDEHGQTIRAGVQGRLVGRIRGTVTGGTFDRNATCAGPECGFTDVFLRTHFGPNAKFSCFESSRDCTFKFDYRARHQGLLFDRWRDRGEGAGTMLKEEFKGDIADA